MACIAPFWGLSLRFFSSPIIPGLCDSARLGSFNILKNISPPIFARPKILFEKKKSTFFQKFPKNSLKNLLKSNECLILKLGNHVDFEFETQLSEWGNWHNRHDFRVWEWGIRWISRDFVVEVLSKKKNVFRKKNVFEKNFLFARKLVGRHFWPRKSFPGWKNGINLG